VLEPGMVLCVSYRQARRARDCQDRRADLITDGGEAVALPLDVGLMTG
jgi:hypothetical protein